VQNDKPKTSTSRKLQANKSTSQQCFKECGHMESNEVHKMKTHAIKSNKVKSFPLTTLPYFSVLLAEALSVTNGLLGAACRRRRKICEA
jgi:hypothetical protein